MGSWRNGTRRRSCENQGCGSHARRHEGSRARSQSHHRRQQYLTTGKTNCRRSGAHPILDRCKPSDFKQPFGEAIERHCVWPQELHAPWSRKGGTEDCCASHDRGLLQSGGHHFNRVPNRHTRTSCRTARSANRFAPTKQMETARLGGHHGQRDLSGPNVRLCWLICGASNLRRVPSARGSGPRFARCHLCYPRDRRALACRVGARHIDP